MIKFDISSTYDKIRGTAKKKESWLWNRVTKNEE